jgi:hypothetical protein
VLWFKRSGLMLLVCAVCLAFVMACSDETDLSGPGSEWTVTPEDRSTAALSPGAGAETATPECASHSAGLSLRATDTQPHVGDVVTVTVTLTNQGCGMLGLPRYSLHAEPAPDPPLFEALPEAVVHSVGLGPGQSDAVEFPLRAVRPGQTTIVAAASFEFHAGYPGPAYWAGASDGSLQIAVRSGN